MPHPANQELRTGAGGQSFIKKAEGYSSVAYQDIVGVWTIGWGTIGEDKVWPGRKISRAMAQLYLEEELLEQEGYVKKYVNVPLNQNQFDALVSLVYNIGVGNFRKSPLLKALNRGQYHAAAALFLKHNRAKNQETGQLEEVDGLTNRREKEMLLFLTPAGPTEVEEKPAPAPVVEEHKDVDPATITSNIVPEKPKASMPPIGEMLKGSDTVKTQLSVFSAMLVLLTQMFEHIKNNPLAAAACAAIVLGVVLTIYFKMRDTGRG